MVLPVHGHYDHALDAPFIAAWAETEIADLSDDSDDGRGTSLEEIINASKIHFDKIGYDLNWGAVRRDRWFDSNKDTIATRNFRDFKITLVRTKHNENPSLSLIENWPFEKETFPLSVLNMRAGASVSVHIEHRGKTMLIVPTSGKIKTEFCAEELKADVLFLGVGGLGFQLDEEVQAYWHNTVGVTQASRVFPIHWDDNKTKIQKNTGENDPVNLNPPIYDAHNRTLRIFDELVADAETEKPTNHCQFVRKRKRLTAAEHQSSGNPEIKFSPLFVKFDPFIKLR